MDQYDRLKLDPQLCFPLHAAAKEIVRLHTPHLEPLGLTIVPIGETLVDVNVKELGGSSFWAPAP